MIAAFCVGHFFGEVEYRHSKFYEAVFEVEFHFTKFDYPGE